MTSGTLTNLQTPHEKVAIGIAGTALLGGAALFIYGEWSVSVGTAGVLHYLLRMIGLLLLGVSLLIIGVWFTRHKAVRLFAKESAERQQILQQCGKQFLTVVLNILIYGGLFILIMGGLSALDGASPLRVVFVLALWAFCITCFVLYRRYRKKHKVGYALIGDVGISLLLSFLSILFLCLGGAGIVNVAQDLNDGPKTADVFLVDARVDNPQWRYRFIIQPNHILTFYTADEKRIVLEFLDADVDRAKVINDLGNFVHLTYYPHTQIFCDAQRWEDGRQMMGQDLLSRLNETYDFDLP